MNNTELGSSFSGKPKMSIVTCYNDREILSENLLKSLNRQHNTDFELLTIDNTEKKFSSIPSALNWGGKKAAGDYIMFVHQDIYLCGDNWLDLASNFLNGLPRLGAAGVAGVASNGNYAGFILDRGRYYGEYFDSPLPVQTLDEQLIIIPRMTFEKYRFDEHFDFHFYGADYCLSAQRLGLSVYVLPLFVEHNSLAVATLRASNIKNQEKILLKKHSEVFKTIWKTTGSIGKIRDMIRRGFASVSNDFIIEASMTFLQLQKITVNQQKVLEVGCLPIEQNAMKKRLAKKLFSIAISPKKRYLIVSRRLGVHDDYVVADPERMPFKAKSFDLAFSSGFLEYLSKEKGERVIKASEEVAKKSLIRVPQSVSRLDSMHLVLDDSYILERSQWAKKDFEVRQYKTFSLQLGQILPGTLYAYK